MTTRPSAIPTWATDVGADITDPGAAKKGTGWVDDESPAHDYFNYWQNLVGQWVDHLKDIQVSNWFAVPAIGGMGSVPMNGVVYDAYHGVFCMVGGAANTDTIWTSPNGLTWTDRSPAGTAGLYFNSVACNQTTGVMCACGHETATGLGVVYKSTDGGATWAVQTITTPLNKHFYGIAHDSVNDVWVCVGETGTIERSTDQGANWAAQVSGSTSDLYGVAHNGSALWCTVGAGGAVLTSAAGTTWAAKTSGVTDPLVSVLWQGTMWLASRSYSGSNDPAIYSATADADTWTQRWLGTSHVGLTSVATDGCAVVFAGEGLILSSTDGLTWVSRATPAITGKSIGYGSGVFCIGGTGGLVYNSLRTA